MNRAIILALLSCIHAGMGSFLTAQELRFAWLTDTHVGGTTGEADLRGSVRDLNAQSGLQFVLLSGDITESGTDVQLRLAKEILDSLRHPLYILPGNHDLKWSESGGRTFRALFGPDRFSFEAGGLTFLGMHQGPLMRMGDGYWAQEDVRWLDSLLGGVGDRNRPIVFVTHYPLDSGIANWYEVLDRLKERNTQCVLVGHGHRNRAEMYEGIPGVMSRANLRRPGAESGYTIVWKEGDSLRFAERDVMRRSTAEWHAVGLRREFVPLPPKEWPRPSFAVNREYDGVKVAWSTSVGAMVAAAGVADGVADGGAGGVAGGGRFYVGGADGNVSCLDLESGRVLWRHATGGAILMTPAVWGGHLVVGSCDSTIRSLRIRDGREEWRIRADGPVLGAAGVKEGIAYVGSSDRRVRAIDVEEGRVIWTSDPFGGFIEARPLVYGGRVIVGAWDGALHALDSATGKVAWEWRGEKPGILLSPAACWPVGSEGRVFIVAPDRKMTSLSAADGRVIWRSGSHEVRETIGISKDGARVFVRLMRDTIMAFSAADSIPTLLWSTPCGFGYDINSAAIVEREGVLFYPTKDGVLIALESLTGRILWKQRIGVGVVHTVSPLSRDRVVTVGFDGVVRLVVAGGGR